MMACVEPNTVLALDGCTCVSLEHNMNLVDEYNDRWDAIENEIEINIAEDSSRWSGLWNTLRDLVWKNNSGACNLGSSCLSMIIVANLY